jgi:hypothetical protein
VTRVRPESCLNCGSDLVRDYCAVCGQRNVDLRLPARELAADALEDSLSLDSRMARTALPFLLRPGFLTAEWAAGRRARYSSPLRLYLLASAVFFLATGIAGGLGPRLFRSGDAGPAGAEAEEAVAEEVAAEAATAEARGAAREAAGLLEGSEEAHRELRSAGALGRFADDRWKHLAGLSRAELRTRLEAAFREWTPRVMFFLVPAAALILALLWRRGWLAAHVVFSLHVHAFAFTAFTAMLLAGLLPWRGVESALRGLLLLSLPLYLVLALRRVHGESWRRTLLKAGVGSLLYLVALGLGLAGVGVLALAFA